MIVLICLSFLMQSAVKMSKKIKKLRIAICSAVYEEIQFIKINWEYTFSALAALNKNCFPERTRSVINTILGPINNQWLLELFWLLRFSFWTKKHSPWELRSTSMCLRCASYRLQGGVSALSNLKDKQNSTIKWEHLIRVRVEQVWKIKKKKNSLQCNAIYAKCRRLPKRL